MRRLRAERRHAVDDIHDKVIPIEVVEHDHVERRGGRPLLFIATHVNVGVIGSPVREAMDQPWIAVIGEDHRLVLGEDLVELRVAQPMWVLGRRLEAHEVDHVDHAHHKLRKVPADQVRGGQRLQRRHVAGAGQDHVGITAFVGAHPVPDAETSGAMRNRIVHGQVVERGLLAGDDHVDIVAAAQAVIGDRKQAVDVGREVDPDDLRLLVGHVVDESRVLVGKAVVVLPPDV